LEENRIRKSAKAGPTVKHPAIAATGTLNGTEITLTENHRHGQIFRFVKKNLEKLRS